MNKENILYSIELMKEAQNFHMSHFQGKDMMGVKHSAAETVEALHKCGNTACFAGYVGVSEKFQLDGGTVSSVTGMPYYMGDTANYAIGSWLGISQDLAATLVYGDIQVSKNGREMCMFYKKTYTAVKPADVIKKLKLILSGELQ